MTSPTTFGALSSTVIALQGARSYVKCEAEKDVENDY